jgi:hypothetical protein
MTANANSIQQYGDCQLLTHATPYYCKVASTTSYTLVYVAQYCARICNLLFERAKGFKTATHQLVINQSNDMAIIQFSDTISVINTSCLIKGYEQLLSAHVLEGACQGMARNGSGRDYSEM